MGRIKTKLTKRKAKELMAVHNDMFTSDFNSNKKVSEKYMEFPSKKIRNIVSGYVTRLKRKEVQK
jgi:ribosomal protein S17E